VCDQQSPRYHAGEGAPRAEIPRLQPGAVAQEGGPSLEGSGPATPKAAYDLMELLGASGEGPFEISQGTLYSPMSTRGQTPPEAQTPPRASTSSRSISLCNILPGGGYPCLAPYLDAFPQKGTVCTFQLLLRGPFNRVQLRTGRRARGGGGGLEWRSRGNFERVRIGEGGHRLGDV